MNKIIISVIIIVLGLLISIGPQLLFRVCSSNMALSEELEDCCAEPELSSCCAPAVGSLPVCHWTARAEIGMGFLISAFGACLLIFIDSKIQSGILTGVFFTGIIALFIPYTLIGGCSSMDMQCHKIAFPALTAECIVLLGLSIIMFYITIRKILYL